MCVCVCPHVHVCTFVYVLCASVCMYVCCAFVYVCICVHMLCVHVYACLNVRGQSQVLVFRHLPCFT